MGYIGSIIGRVGFIVGEVEVGVLIVVCKVGFLIVVVLVLAKLFLRRYLICLKLNSPLVTI